MVQSSKKLNVFNFQSSPKLLSAWIAFQLRHLGEHQRVKQTFIKKVQKSRKSLLFTLKLRSEAGLDYSSVGLIMSRVSILETLSHIRD